MMFFVPSLVAISLVLAGTVNGNQCSTAELLSIAGNSNLDGCTSEVGFGGFAAISALTEEQIKAFCDSTQCIALMEDMRAMDFGNCVIEGTNISLGTDILDPFAKVCSGSGSVDLSASSIDKDSVGSAASGASTNAIGWLSTFALTTTMLFI
ncbi:hypothetical protein PF005_g29030 [Phytophthora fragariae]|uniref:Elicitin n=1 Tax=Phytophthora fragariae TaxID=53985 RepID=A0A6A3QCQ2_9STRA|nr:hypothetical protein PF003_g35137 [Phytophthora fragariae]KAE8919877.1 hypothetical protein PF009_g29823 [Phytophthora fragariae]KAE8964963.1 hypothetical protein PF011_g28477 [Phytophthora fragariae]KAE9063326.1 hypothetical protein PF010_g29040 [Phytophthora fragariae]KAE9065326.1 hypothetical protein PF007_g28883 [Phytophthora fragariae]